MYFSRRKITKNLIKMETVENNNSKTESKRLLAGILAIVLGPFAVHKFILGYTKEGVIQLIVNFVTCGVASIISIIEGVIYLTKSDEEFIETYQVNKKGWF